ncbi:MAG: hypothetical protein K9H16_05075 [Bacteroidales bacterium]|nr:hypothetical protein [Bacteroidales bacterium]
MADSVLPAPTPIQFTSTLDPLLELAASHLSVTERFIISPKSLFKELVANAGKSMRSAILKGEILAIKFCEPTLNYQHPSSI